MINALFFLAGLTSSFLVLLVFAFFSYIDDEED